MKLRPAQIAPGLVGLALGVAGVLALREATLSTHGAVDPTSSVAVVLDARSKGSEPSQSLPELVEALLLTCRLEVNSDLTGPIDATIEGGGLEGGGRFRAVLQPELDETDRLQLRGCIEDWTIDHLLVDVVAFEPSG